MVKTTHPDGGGDARSFDAVVRAFEDIRRTLSRPPSGALSSTPYDTWLRPFAPDRSRLDDEDPRNGAFTESTGRGATPTSALHGSDFSAVLLDEMSKVQDLVTA